MKKPQQPFNSVIKPGGHVPLDHVDRVTKLPYRKVVLKDGTTVQPSWSPENVSGHEKTQSWVRSVADSQREPNPAGDPTHGMKQRVTFARPVEVEPTVSFANDQKHVTFKSEASQQAQRQSTPVNPAEKTFRRKIVGG